MQSVQWKINLKINGEQTSVMDEFSTEDEMEALDLAYCLYQIDDITVESVERVGEHAKTT